ncbi:MAG: hypothetical protein ACKVUS_16200 [Saprospiraceae bacterium]
MQKTVHLIAVSLWLLAATAPTLHAQTDKNHEAILSTTMLVELSGNAQFDAFFQKAVTAHWKVTPYKFVTNAELASVVSDKSVAMLRLVTTSSGKDAMEDSYFVILRGGKKKLTKYTTADQILSADFQFNGAETNSMKAGYRAAFLIKGLNDDLTTLKKQQKKEAKSGNIMKANNTRVKALKTKILLVAEESLKYKSRYARTLNRKAVEAKDLEGYRYKYQVMPMEQIKEYISRPSEETKDFCVFVPRFNFSKAYEIYDINTAERLYYFFPKVAFKASLSKDDFEDLSDEVGGKKK